MSGGLVIACAKELPSGTGVGPARAYAWGSEGCWLAGGWGGRGLAVGTTEEEGDGDFLI